MDHSFRQLLAAPKRPERVELDLQPDGSLVSFHADPPDGLLGPDTVDAGHRAGTLAAHGATLCIRRDLVFALGGWPTMPASEDVALMLALEAVAPSWFIGEAGYYRQHVAQSINQPSFADPTEQRARRVLITQTGRGDAPTRLANPAH